METVRELEVQDTSLQQVRSDSSCIHCRRSADWLTDDRLVFQSRSHVVSDKGTGYEQ